MLGMVLMKPILVASVALLASRALPKLIYSGAGAFVVHPKHDAALNSDGAVGGGDQSSA